MFNKKTFTDCKDKGWLRYDFYLPAKNILIEYNGKQHYESVEWWGGEKHLIDIKRRDNVKKEYAKNKGIKLLIIKYDEDVKEKLKNGIA